MRTLYKILSIIGDIQSISKGTYGKRLVRKQAHKSLAKGLRKILK